jgi:RHS repeat-associated protein
LGLFYYRIIQHHKRLTGDTELVVKEAFTYSPQDRLLTHTHQINGGTVQLLADNTYDELGQLTSKKVGNTSSMPLQKVDYTYNIRGWLTSINNDATNNLVLNTTEKDLFGFKINYNTIAGTVADVKPLYNGNIAETYWRTDAPLRKYGYVYDNLNRLKSAVYQKPGNAIPVSGAYNESLSYDKNGNIISLQRFGTSDAPSVVFQIDDLSYEYSTANGNQLTKVTDGPKGNNGEGFIDGNKTGDDYTYDGNGNLITDKNKNITAIVYNHLNLPTKITFGTTGTIEYIYSAAGQKLEKIVTQGTTITTTDYLGGYQYLKPHTGSWALQFFPTAEGYVTNNAGVFAYVYQYKDHLGNVRLSYSDTSKNGIIETSEIIAENNYYPFGLLQKGYNNTVNGGGNAIAEGYRYNSKEYQDELNLNVYDYGFRHYMPDIGRWGCIDPLAEKSRRWSPYNYCVDNPIRFIDPDGREIINIEGGVKFTGEDAKLAFKTIQKQVKEEGGIKGIHFVNESDTPNIYQHTLNSFRNGKPGVLHYDSDQKAARQRRYQATKNYPSRGKEGLQRDEYPYASTTEGGAGADVAYVPAAENSRQGLQELAPLYKTLKSGDAFLVWPVPKDREPDAEPVPEPVSNLKPVGIGIGLGVIGIGIYETVKWGGAILLAPETGGASLAGAAALP